MRAANSARSLLVCGIVLVAGGFVASAMGFNVLGTGQETHGKLSVKLTEKFTLRFPQGTTGVAWSPDGATLAVSSNASTKLNTYDRSGHELSQFQSKGSEGFTLQRLAFINGASQVLFPLENIHQSNAALDIRDIATGNIVKTITGNYIAQYFAVSPDQKRLAFAGGVHGEAIIYATKDGKEWQELSIVKGSSSPLAEEKTYWYHDTSLSFFPDGKLLAIGKTDGHFSVADSTTGETLKEFKAYDAPGIDDNVAALAVSPKGDLILIGLDPVAISYDVTPEGSAWARSNHALASIWRVSDGKQIAGLPDRGKLIRQAAWDPQGRFVAFIDTDSLILWNPEESGENFTRIKLPGLSASLAITRDGKSLAVAGGNSVIVYKIEDNQ